MTASAVARTRRCKIDINWLCIGIAYVHILWLLFSYTCAKYLIGMTIGNDSTEGSGGDVVLWPYQILQGVIRSVYSSIILLSAYCK